jgi:hypothetical protein
MHRYWRLTLYTSHNPANIGRFTGLFGPFTSRLTGRFTISSTFWDRFINVPKENYFKENIIKLVLLAKTAESRNSIIVLRK